MSRAGFDGGLDPRILSSGEETLRRHGPSEEVPAGVARSRRSVGVGERPPDRARRARILACRRRRCASYVRQVEADEGLRPDLPSSQEREEIKQLRKEVYELRRANEILKAASVFFATELDADRPK